MEDYYKEQREVIESIKEIDEKIQNEIEKGKDMDKSFITKMRFEQLLRGLYITQDPLNLR